MKSTGKKILTALLAGMCVLCGTSGAQAADSYAGINLGDNEDCTVTVTLADSNVYEDKAVVYVEGAKLSLVKAACLNPDGTYTLESAFSELDADAWNAYLAGDEKGVADLSRQAAQIAEKSETAVKASAVTGADGQAVLDVGNAYGIYVLYQSGQESGTIAEKYAAIAPTLVSIPLMKSDTNGMGGHWVIHQQLLPKTVRNTGTSVRVRKRAAAGDGSVTDTKIIGAKLQIVTESGEALESWITTDVDHDSKPLAPGMYILQESEAPDGYRKADDIPFTVKADGTILVNGMALDDNSIVMADPVQPEQTTTAVTSTPESRTSEPASPEASTQPESRTTVVVSTGDRLNAGLWALIAIAAACAILFALIMRGKKNEEGQPR